jgi:hypothetical protein
MFVNDDYGVTILIASWTFGVGRNQVCGFIMAMAGCVYHFKAATSFVESVASGVEQVNIISGPRRACDAFLERVAT